MVCQCTCPGKTHREGTVWGTRDRSLVPAGGKAVAGGGDRAAACSFAGLEPGHPRQRVAAASGAEGSVEGALLGRLVRDHLLGHLLAGEVHAEVEQFAL